MMSLRNITISQNQLFSPGKKLEPALFQEPALPDSTCGKVPRDLGGVVKWRKQCPGSRIPPGLALAEAEQVHFKLLDFLVDLHCPLRVK